MITDYILNVPTATALEELSPEVQEIVRSLGSEWPSFPMVGTQGSNGRKLIHVRMNRLLTEEVLASMLSAYGLDWTIYCIRSAYKEGTDVSIVDGEEIITPVYIVEKLVEKALFVPFMNPVYDIATESMRPVTLSDTFYLSTYAGTEPLEL
jgi:hypothetical protein